MKIFVLLLTIISSVFAADYFCPIEAYGWTLVDNHTGQVYQWNWNSKTNEFNRDLPVIELSRRYQVVCLDINEKMYEAILINRKQFSLNWICDYEKNEGQLEIQSWLFDEEFSPEKIVFQIQNFYHVELFEKKTIRIPFGAINEIVDYVSVRKNSSAYFYELILDYGDRSGLTTVHLRPIFEEQFYIVRLSAHHNNETFVTIQCASMYVNRIEHNEIDSISWYNFTTLLSTTDQKLHLKYSQIIFSELTCIVSDCFSRFITHIQPKYY